MRKLKNEELDRMTPGEYRNSEKTPITLILDDVRSGLNVGSVFRTADAFRCAAIYCCGITGTPPNKDVLKTALGATETVSWQYCESVQDAIEACRSAGQTVVAVEQTDESTGLDVYDIDPAKQYALVFGHEVKGVSDQALQLADGVLDIPQIGTKHSLNVAVSAGIVTWHFYQRIKA